MPDKLGLSKEPFRTDWRRDYARIIHSASFRRLQGKTQLFPYFESDFFRNRLTHSLEVAQIAKSIAIRINNTVPFFKDPEFNIEPDIPEIAGLAHDLGHPPFGHNGEKALDDCMKPYGGFEGNAQTFRILTKIEKRQKESNSSDYGIDKKGNDRRLGLNLTYRTLAAVLKYDKAIPKKRKKDNEIVKGYYHSEAHIVHQIKSHVCGTNEFKGDFKTIECQIMDIADDIAYSTYDLEDAFKAGFINPLNMIGIDDELADQVTDKVSHAINSRFTKQELKDTLYQIFEGIFDGVVKQTKKFVKLNNHKSFMPLITGSFNATLDLISDGYLRSSFSSALIESFLQGIRVEVDNKYPVLSKVSLEFEKLVQVEALKQLTYACLINSSKLKVAEYRGYEIVKTIFELLSNEKQLGYKLMPEDYQALYNSFIKKSDRMRVICDFIAGMTDRYVLEFYGRLKSENPQTIFKPL
ncbi:MAG TPA: dNTP triphosphohydrolase [Thermodesulfobacteriota bacterium]|nr:dNTP triphosphohydrolase [Thermodesulfobacteriota bacterium]